MAINVPVSVPNAPQPANPEPFLNAYLSRPTPYQVAGQQVSGGLENLVGYQKYQQNRQLEALKAISDLYGAGGPRAVQSYGPTLNRVAGTNLIDPSQGQAQGGAPSYAPANGGGGLPSNGSTAPQQSAQTFTQPQPQQMSQPPQQSTLNDPVIQQHAQSLGWNPNHPDYAGQLQSLGSQMASFNDQGKYGTTQQEGLAKQVPVVTAQMNDAREREQFQSNQQREKNTTVANEVGKQTQSADETRQLRGLYNDLDEALNTNKPSLMGNVAGKVSQLTGGRIGQTAISDQNVLNAANPLATTLNTVLSRRFNSGEVQMLSNSLIPQPKDTQQVRQQKMQRLGKMISTMEQGNEQNIRNVGTALMGQVPNISGQPSQSPQNVPAIHSKAQYLALPNGASYTWNGQPHIKGKS